MGLNSDFDWLQSTRFDDIPQIRHGFAVGANNDVSPIDLGSSGLNSEIDNWERVLKKHDPARTLKDLVTMNQVHGGQAMRVTSGRGPVAPIGDVDGCVTTRPDLVLAVRTADCCPILLGCASGVGVAHAGWRGVAANVVGNTVELLKAVTGCPVEEVHAVIGPCISSENYQVGIDVIDGIASSGVPTSIFVRESTEGLYADIGAAILWQLNHIGVTRVERIAKCTFSDSRLHSYRRDGGNAGRLAGLISRSANI